MALSYFNHLPRGFCISVEGDAVRVQELDVSRFVSAEREAASTRRGARTQGQNVEFECDGSPVAPEVVVAELDRVHRHHDAAPWVPLAAVFVLYFAIAAALGAKLSTLAILAIGIFLLAAITGLYVGARALDRARSTIYLWYRLDDVSIERFAQLQQALQRLASAERVWHVPGEGRPIDQKRRYGAQLLLRRYRIRPQLVRPERVRTNVRVPTLYGEHRKFYFFPDRVLVFDESVRALPYALLAPTVKQTLCLEDEDVPLDARVVDSAWLHARQDGSPDPAYANNRRYPIVLYGELDFVGPAGIREVFLTSSTDATSEIIEAFDRVAWGDAERDTSTGETCAESEPRPDDEDEPKAESDALYDDALRLLVREGHATLELLVSELEIDYACAAQLLSDLEQDGYVGPAYRNRPRSLNRAAIRYVELRFGETGPSRSSRDEPPPGNESRSRRRSPRRRTKNPRTPHDILGVPADASRDEIIEAYRHMAQLYHPDKVASLAPEFQDLADRRMKEINAAYRELLRRA